MVVLDPRHGGLMCARNNNRNKRKGRMKKMTPVVLGWRTAKSSGTDELKQKNYKVRFFEGKPGLYQKNGEIRAAGCWWLCLMALTCVGGPINLNHMSKKFMCLLANTVWTQRFELRPPSVAIRGRTLQGITVRSSTTKNLQRTPLKNAKKGTMRCSEEELWPFR